MTEFLNTEPAPKSAAELIEDHEIFVQALACQSELNGNEFPDYRSAKNAAFAYAQELDKISQHYNIAYKAVTIRGDDIIVPAPNIDYNLGSIDLPSGKIGRTADALFAEPCVSGAFFGFTGYGLPIDSDLTRFRAVIGYQIAMDSTMVDLPNFYGALLACGPISSSSLEFLEDRKQKNAHVAIEKLMTIEDESTIDMISTIEKLLSGDTCFDPNNLRSAAHLIRRHLDNDGQNIDDRHKDALLDLVKARLGLYDNQPFILDASSSLETTSEPYNYIVRQGSRQATDRPAPHVSIKDVVFAPYYFKKGEDYTVDTRPHTLSIIVERPVVGSLPKMVSIPFETIRSLKPVPVAAR